MTYPAAPATLEQALALLAERDQALAQLRQSQEEFLRAVSHDLRAPLRHITSYGSLVREVLDDAGLQGEAADEARQFLGTMDQSARRMARMLDGLLAIARAARAPLNLQAVDLAALAVQAKVQVEAGPAAGPVTRQIEWALPMAPCVVTTDAALMQQLLIALLDNAVKFTRPQPLARISIIAVPASEGAWSMTVQDNGTGFDPAQAGGLGGVFQRLHRENEFEGVGAGLALVQTIAHRLGLQWQICAQPGAGCTVTVDGAAATRG